jgi:hypothetical protein
MNKFLKIGVSLVLITLVSATLSMAIGMPPLLTAGLLFGAGFLMGIFKLDTTMNKTNLYSAFTISDTTYAGEAASAFIVKALTGNETVQGGHVYVKDGIKKKFTIPRWDADYEDLIQDRQATPISKGTMTVDGKTLTPADYMIYMEFNPRDFEDHWYATQLNNKLIDTTLPVSAESTIVQEVLKRHDRFANKIMWGGDTTLTTIYKYFDGFVKKATDASDTLDLAASSILTTTLAANILAELARLYALIPAALKYEPNMKIFMGYELYDALDAAYIANANKGKYFDDGRHTELTYRGLRVCRIADMPLYKIVIAKGTSGMDSNMWVGMNSTDDASIELNKVQNNGELWFVKVLCKMDVQYGWNSEVINYV